MTDIGPALFEAPHEVPPVSEMTAALIKSLKDLYDSRKNLETQVEIIEGELEKLIPPEPGTYEMTVGDLRLIGERPESWRWDKEELARMFASGDAPPFVKRSVSVDREAFEALPPAEQTPLLHLLRRRPSKAVKFRLEKSV